MVNCLSQIHVKKIYIRSPIWTRSYWKEEISVINDDSNGKLWFHHQSQGLRWCMKVEGWYTKIGGIPTYDEYGLCTYHTFNWFPLEMVCGQPVRIIFESKNNNLVHMVHRSKIVKLMVLTSPK